MRPVDTSRVCVIGLGYVGLPLAVAFSKVFDTVGHDLDESRLTELREGRDRTREIEGDDLTRLTTMDLRGPGADLSDRDVFIVTVPTPVDDDHQPDLAPLTGATRAVAAVLKTGDLVIYESTVYPGCTEEVCVPILEEISGLKFNTDFFCGYSPERANPGDMTRRLTSIVKVTSGSTPEAARFVADLYGRIMPPRIDGRPAVHMASSIAVAEAAKVIENTQRDLNIALINEFAKIFNRLDIDTAEVLAAAGTKWNFLPFQPGLVGGHCIGVDPYYLTHKAQEIGYDPKVILAGREINDGMGAYVAGQVAELMAATGIAPAGARVLVLGLAFKENCPDLRNTKVVEVIATLRGLGLAVDVHDPWVDPAAARHEYDLGLTAQPEAGAYDAVVLAVAHTEFRALGAAGVRAFGRPGAVLYDVKSVFDRQDVDGRL